MVSQSGSLIKRDGGIIRADQFRNYCFRSLQSLNYFFGQSQGEVFFRNPSGALAANVLPTMASVYHDLQCFVRSLPQAFGGNTKKAEGYYREQDNRRTAQLISHLRVVFLCLVPSSEYLVELTSDLRSLTSDSMLYALIPLPPEMRPLPPKINDSAA